MPQSLINWIPIQDWVFVDIYDDGEAKIKIGNKTLWLPADDTFGKDTMHKSNEKHRGIRGRWAMVLGVNERGEEAGLKVGQKVYLDELKWTRGFLYDNTRLKAWAIKIDDILCVDEDGFEDDEAEHIFAKYFDAESQHSLSEPLPEVTDAGVEA